MENPERIAGMQDVAPLIQSLKSGGILENLQRCFCKIANVFLYCVDKDGFPLTDFGGKEEEIGRIKELIETEQLQNMLTRISESTLEDQAIETTAYPNLRLAVATVRAGVKPVLSWVACGVLFDEEDVEDYDNPPLEGFTSLIGELQFARTMDALRDMTDALIRERLSVVNAQAADRRSRYLEKEMGEKLARSQMLGRLIQVILESGEVQDKTIYKYMKLTGEFLELNVAALYRICENNECFEMISRWCSKTTEWKITEISNNQIPALLRTEKTLVLSGKSMLGEREKEALGALDLRALILLPVEMGIKERLYACFGMKDKDRVWELEEIRFLSDAVRILQYGMAGQMHNNLLIRKLESILEQVGAALCIRKIETGDILYANREMRAAFEKELSSGDVDNLLGPALQSSFALKLEGNKEHGESKEYKVFKESEEPRESKEFYYAKKKRWYELNCGEIVWTDESPALLYTLRDCTDRKRKTGKKT